MFGKRMTPAERLRKNQRMLDKAIRELDQIRVKLEKQEKTLVGQIKQSAQKGQMGACKIQAKDLVRTRRYAGLRAGRCEDGGCVADMLGPDTSRSFTPCAASSRRFRSDYRYDVTCLACPQRISGGTNTLHRPTARTSR